MKTVLPVLTGNHDVFRGGPVRQPRSEDHELAVKHSRGTPLRSISIYNADMASVFFESMKERIGFTERDATNLRTLRPLIEQDLEAVTESFYRWLLLDSQTRTVFTGGEEQMGRLRQAFHNWLHDLFLGLYDDAYYLKHLAIGHTHVRVGLPQHYMFLAMEIVWRNLQQIINRTNLPNREERLKSLHKLLTLETAIMMESYRDSYASRIRREERLVVEEKLTRSEHLAQIGQLAASLAHEIKNPLAGISGAIQVIRDGMSDDDPHRVVIREILGQINRLDAAVKDLLVYARPNPPEFSSCSLFGVVHAMLNLNRGLPLLRRLQVTVEAEENLPPVMADPGQIEQLVMNLLFNAAHASREGGVIRFRLSRNADRVRILIADEGHGMDEVTRQRAFEPFFTTKAKGTGLGLSICTKIIESHGGTMTLDSEPDVGTTVTIELPIDRARAAACEPQAGADGLETEATCGSPAAAASGDS